MSDDQMAIIISKLERLVAAAEMIGVGMQSIDESIRELVDLAIEASDEE